MPGASCNRNAELKPKFLKQCPCAFPKQSGDGSSVCAVATLCCSEMERNGPGNKGTIHLPIHNRRSFQMRANSDNVGSECVTWAIQHPNWFLRPEIKRDPVVVPLFYDWSTASRSVSLQLLVYSSVLCRQEDLKHLQWIAADFSVEKDSERAGQCRERGNACFKTRDYTAAARHYSMVGQRLSPDRHCSQKAR